jgi:ribosomal 50S subunit-recycling heat shock protein
MRIDLLLKFLCLVKSRSVAKTLCANDRILVGGRPVRPSHRVAAGQRVTIHFRTRTVTVELREIPEKQLSKSTAVDYYRRVETPPEDKPGAVEGDGDDNWRDS